MDRVSPSMVNRIDARKLWQRAGRDAGAQLKVHGQTIALHLPKECALAIEDIVDQEFDFSHAVAKVIASGR